MLIFYDFETSARDVLGQILSYSFIATDSNYTIVEELNGTIKCTRTQFPEPGALLTNKINITHLQHTGDTEFYAAQKIFQFLSKHVAANQSCTLIGFNSNQFDLNFLRNLLIRYGLNPYFSGRLKNCDILHFSRYLAMEFPSTFKWNIARNINDDPYYSFKLETLSKAYGVLDTAQSHDARADVILTIDLVKKFEEIFQFKLSEFNAYNAGNFPTDLNFLFREIKIPFPATGPLPDAMDYTLWVPLIKGSKDMICVDISAFSTLPAFPSEDELLSCIRYFNANKAFFQTTPATEPDYDCFKDALTRLAATPLYQSLKRDSYFSKTEKDWDIEYQIHKLGFDRIDTLKENVDQLLSDPELYMDILSSLLKKRSDPADNYLIQLFNRVYLNYHPNAKVEYLHKYLVPRYITGTIYRNSEDFTPLAEQLAQIEFYCVDESLDANDRELMRELKAYSAEFIAKNKLGSLL